MAFQDPPSILAGITHPQVISTPGAGDAMASGLNAVLAAFLQKQQLDQQHQSFQADLANKQAETEQRIQLAKMTGAETDKYKQDIKDAQEKSDQAKEQHTLMTGALGFVAANATKLGDGAALGQTITDGLQHGTIKPEHIPYILDAVGKTGTTMKALADAREASGKAQTAQAQGALAGPMAQAALTEQQGKASTAQTDASLQRPLTLASISEKQAAAAASQAQAKKTLAELQAGPGVDTKTFNIFKGYLGLGLPAAVAAQNAGMPLPTGMAPDFQVSTKATDKQRMNDARLQLMQAQDAVMRQIPQQTGWTAAMSHVPFGAGQYAMSAPQQQLYNASRGYAQETANILMGARATDALRQELMRTFSPVAGDKAPVLAQKQAFRGLLNDAVQMTGTGKITASKAIDQAIKKAALMKMPPDYLKTLGKMKMEALQNDAHPPVELPAAPQTQDDTQTYLDNIGTQ